MAQRERVSFKSDGKRVAFWAARQTKRAAKYGARKLREHRARKVPYQQYQTPAQRKAAQSKPKPRPKTAKPRSRQVVRKVQGNLFARCPICHNLQYGFHTRAQANAWIVRHVTKYHGRRT